MKGAARAQSPLVLAFMRATWGRALLIVLPTALVSALLLVVATVLQLGWAPVYDQVASGLIANPGVRGGYLFALVLTCLAPMMLLRQVTRLGSAAREHRWAMVRLCGATPGEVQRLAAFEVGLPALVGGLAGWPIYLALRAYLGTIPFAEATDTTSLRQQTRLIPTNVDLPWWSVVVVLAAVGLTGAWAGYASVRRLTESPLGAARRAPVPAPRAWTWVAWMVAAFTIALLASRSDSGAASTLLAIAAIIAGSAGLLIAAPWVAHRVGLVVANRSRRAHTVVAARRLVVDPRSAGRAGAALGVVGAVAGGAGVFAANLYAMVGDGSLGAEDRASYTVPLALVGVVLLVAMLLIVLSMAVRGVDELVDRRRSTASLAALGVDISELLRIQRWEVGLVALPTLMVGVLLGWLGMALMTLGAGHEILIPAAVASLTLVVGVVSVVATTLILRPWIVQSASLDHLRTP